MPVSRSRNEKAFSQFRAGAQDRRIAASVKGNSSAAIPRASDKAKAARIEELKKYPLKSYIVWKFGDHTPEQVIKHDTKLGRLITDKRGNYDPLEVDPYIKE